MKDEVAYSPVIGKAVIEAFSATAHAVGDFFPEGSADPARSTASPKIWEDAAGFQAELAKFGADVAAAREASGKDGPADKAAFAAAVQPIMRQLQDLSRGLTAWRTEAAAGCGDCWSGSLALAVVGAGAF